jgi:DNA processing protein
MKEDALYQLALGSIPGIGPVYARRLLHRFGEARSVFQAPEAALVDVLGKRSKRAHDIAHFKGFSALEKEQAFLEKYSIRSFFLTDQHYPQRLLRCPDAPILLFFKGHTDLNASRIISIIGTRSPSEYGKQATEKLIKDMASLPGTLIISGLAFGIDAVSHQAALKNHLPTVGVLGHGLDQIYPREHASLAREMLKTGGLLTKFGTSTRPDAYNFPIRNRIVAGISDAVIVTETRPRGGSMLTVENALAYHRKVFAIPGRIMDERSAGCNVLIRDGKARLLTGVAQLMEEMNWQKPSPATGIQQASLFPSSKESSGLSDDEWSLLQLFHEKKALSITDIHAWGRQSAGLLAITLLNLELLGHISSLPGKMYRLCE